MLHTVQKVSNSTHLATGLQSQTPQINSLQLRSLFSTDILSFSEVIYHLLGSPELFLVHEAAWIASKKVLPWKVYVVKWPPPSPGAYSLSGYKALRLCSTVTLVIQISLTNTDWSSPLWCPVQWYGWHSQLQSPIAQSLLPVHQSIGYSSRKTAAQTNLHSCSCKSLWTSDDDNNNNNNISSLHTSSITKIATDI
jgi:hypothetical protein